MNTDEWMRVVTVMLTHCSLTLNSGGITSTSSSATIFEAERTIKTILFVKEKKKKKKAEHTTAGIRWWSPPQLLTGRRVA